MPEAGERHPCSGAPPMRRGAGAAPSRVQGRAGAAAAGPRYEPCRFPGGAHGSRAGAGMSHAGPRAARRPRPGPQPAPGPQSSPGPAAGSPEPAGPAAPPGAPGGPAGGEPRAGTAGCRGGGGVALGEQNSEFFLRKLSQVSSEAEPGLDPPCPPLGEKHKFSLLGG